MRSEISTVFEKGYDSGFNRILKTWLPATANRQLAKKVFPLIQNDTAEFRNELQIPKYEGNNPTVKLISDYLESRSHPAIRLALIQGSIASGEEVNYSDFDGILLIDEKRIENIYSLQSLLHLLDVTNSMMLQQDALQHHGWNILTTTEMGNYPDDHLPIVLLQNSKVFYPQRNAGVQYTLTSENLNYKKGFDHLCRSILKKCSSNSPAGSFRQFKTYVSEMLLLPAMYVQAVQYQPIFKKVSFERFERLVPPSLFSITDKYSQLRSKWDQSDVTLKKEQRYLRFRSIGKAAFKLATPLPERYREFVMQEAYLETESLIRGLQQSVLRG